MGRSSKSAQNKNRKRVQNTRRKPRLETLERRDLLAVDWRNPVNNVDVNVDSAMTAIDALAVINDLNLRGTRQLPDSKPADAPNYLDVDGNGFVNAIDALVVINRLNVFGPGNIVLQSQGQFAQQRDVTITVGGESAGARLYRVDVDSQFDPFSSNGLNPDLLAVYLVDPSQSDTTLLDRGENGTSIFSLSANGEVELALGLVSWNGTTLEIDLTEVDTTSTAALRFQLLVGESQSRSKVTITPRSNSLDATRQTGELAVTPSSVFDPGAPIATGTLLPAPHINIRLFNSRYDAESGDYIAEFELQNGGNAIGRTTALVFPDLTPGITVKNRSGVDGFDRPYINFSPAINAGGLGLLDNSNRVKVVFANPGNRTFSLDPFVLVGPPNRSPQIPALGSLTVIPGEQLEIALPKNDADGDPVRYSLRNVNGDLLPKSHIDTSNGRLTFAPTPMQLGSYTLELTATDGVIQSTRSFTLNVIRGSVTTTRVSGRILEVEGNSPLAGMIIEMGAIQTITDSNGRFVLDLGSGPIVSETLRVRGDRYLSGAMYPFIAEKLPYMLDHEIYTGYNNVILRPIYLPKLNPGSAINPNNDVIVSQGLVPNEKPAEVLIRANTLFTQQGSPFTGGLSITEVPPERTPAALPAGLRTDLVVTIQPGEMSFASPAPLSLPNRSNLPAGTPMDLWSINPVTGEFERVGGAIVSDDGQSVTTVSGGIRNSSWHFFSPEPDVNVDYGQNPRNEKDDREKCPCARAGLTSEVELSSGALIESHTLTSYQSMGVERALKWSYDSKRADPRPIVHVGFANVRPGSDRLLMATVEMERNGITINAPGYAVGAGENYGLKGGENFWKIPVEGGNVNGAIQMDLSAMATGIYQVRTQQGLVSFVNNRIVGATTDDVDRFIHVNGIGSAFGNGWGLAGLQQLFEEANGDVLIVDGDGGDGDQQLFTRNTDGTYSSTPGDFSVLTKLVNGQFQRRETDGTVSEFAPSGWLASVRDRIGNTIRYEYAAGDIPQLNAIVDPVGLRTVFSYTNGRVSSVTDPANRITRFEYDQRGNLIRITDPDGTFRSWNYDSANRMIGETDKRGGTESATYHFSGRVIGAVRKDGSRIEVQPLQLQGLYPPERTASPAAPPFAHRALTVESLYFDGNGNWSKSTLDDRGQELFSRDSIGRKPQVIRDAHNQVTSTIDARGHATHYRYDERGNVVSQRDEVSSSTRLIEAILSDPAEVDEYLFTAKPGQRLIVDGLGSTNGRAQVSITGDFVLNEGQAHSGTTDSPLLTSDFGVYVFPRGGEFKIRVSADIFATGPVDYRFRLLDIANAVPIEPGIWIEGISEYAGATTLYQFQGRAGQEIVGQWQGATTSSWLILGPSLQDTNGSSSINGGVGANLTTTLPATGTYWILVRAEQANTPYSFRIVEPQVVQASLTFGADYNPNLSRFGDHYEYTFQGTMGQVVLLNPFITSLNMRGELISPSGAQRIDWVFAGPQLLRETGLYRYRITSAAETELMPSFQILDWNAAQPLPFGTDTLATVTQPLEAAVYRFTASAGDRLAVEDLTNLFGTFSSEFRIYDSQGQEVYVSRTGNDRTSTFVLPFSGSYFLVGNSTNSEVAANIRFRASFATTTSFNATLGSTLAGTLVRYGDIHEYQFNVSAGMNVFFDAPLNRFYTELVSPSGKLYPSPLNVETLAESGVYRFRVYRDGRLGDTAYQLRLLHVEALTTQPLSTTITTNPSQTQPVVLRWNASAGMHLKAEFLDSTTSYLEWYSPLGTQVFGSSIVASVAGSYTLLVRSSQSQPESVRLKVTDVSQGLTTPTGLNRPITGTLSGSNHIDIPFRVSAGVNIALEDRANSGGLTLNLVDRDGKSIAARFATIGNLIWVEVPTSAETFIRIENVLGTAQDYDYFLHDLSSAPLLSLGSYTEGTINAQELKIWRINLTAGRTVTLDRDHSVTSNPLELSLLRRDATVTGSSISVGQDAIDFSGEYFVVARAPSTNEPYAFRLLDPSSASHLSLNLDLTASTSRPAQKLQYLFEVSSPQLLSLDFLSQVTLLGSWSVSSASGANIASGELQSARFQVTTPGTYLLSLDLRDVAPTSLSFRLSEARSVTRSLNFGMTESVEFERMGDSFQYSFSLQAGDQVLLDPLVTSDVTATWTTSNGSAPKEFEFFSSSDEKLTTILKTGTYFLTVRPTYLIPGNNTNFSFRLHRGSQATAVATDMNNSVVLDPGNATQLFRFDGMAGLRISFSRTSAASSLYISLYSPFGVVQSYAWEDFEALLPVTGRYVLAISGVPFNNERVETEFRLSLGTESTTPLEWNQLATGSVPGVADRVNYILQGVAGQRILFLPETDNGHRFQFFAPSGRLLDAQFTLGSRLITELQETGEYRLVVQRSAAVGANPNFGFRILDLEGNNPVPNGQEFAVSFPSGNEVVVVQVSTPAPHGLEARIVGTGSADVSMSWLEHGQWQHFIGSAEGAYRIPNKSNQGWLLLRGRGTASIELRMIVSAIHVEDKATPLDQSLSGTFNHLATAHRYKVAVAPLTSLYIETLPTTSSRLTVTPPGEGPTWLNQAALFSEKEGQYEFLFEHNEGATSTTVPSQYSFRVNRLLDLPITPIGSTISANIGQNTYSSLSRLRVATPQRIQFRQVSVESAPTPLLYDAQGNIIYGKLGIYYLPAATDIWVVMRGFGATPTNVSFAVEAVTDPIVTESGLDTPRSLAISAGGHQDVEFVARTGTRVFLEIPRSIRDEVSYDVTDPSGFSKFFGESFIIDQSGTYNLRFNAYSTGVSGSIVIRKEANLPSLALGHWKDLDVNKPSRTELLRVDTQPGRRYWLDIESTTTSSLVSTSFLLDNASYAQLTSSGLIDVGASESLAIQIQWPENHPATRIRLLDLTDSQLLAFDNLQVERIGPNQFDARTYKFEGQAGDRFRFSNTTEARFFPTNSYLISPSGDVITSSTAQRSWEATLTEDGTHYIVIDGSIPSSEDYRFRLLRGSSSRTVLRVASSGNIGNAASFTYDANFSVMTSAIDELGRRTEYTIDPANGNVVRVSELGAIDDPTPARVSQYTYNALGLVVSETDPLGRLTEHEYDSLGRRTRTTIAVGTPVAATTRWEYDAAGNATAIIDPLGRRTEYTYDLLNRVQTWKEPDPDGPGPATSPLYSFQYDAHGNLVRSTDALLRAFAFDYDVLDRLTTQTDANQKVSHSEYDSANNLILQIDELGRRTSYRYDSRNRMVEIINPLGGRTILRYNADDQLSEFQDPLGRVTKYEYDARGRMISSIDPLLGVRSTEYDPADQVIASKDELGRATSYLYNPFGELVQAIDALGGVSQAEYDAMGNQTRVIDATNKSTSMTYDAQDRLVVVTNAIGGQRNFNYDLVGNLIRIEDELQRPTTFEYDALNRLIRTRDSLNGTWTNTYDLVGNLRSVNDPRNQTTIADYDAMDRLIQRTNPDNAVERWFHDAKGNLTAQEDAEGRRTTYTYDALDRLIETRDPLLNLTSFAYDAVGNLLSLTDGLRKTTRQEYDLLDRMVKQIDPRNGETTFEYDAVGNRISLTDPVQNKTTFAYDALNRLTHETNVLGKSLVWKYNAVGNVMEAIDRNGRHRTFSYDDLHRNTQERWLDGSGNSIREINWAYDAASQLLSARDPDSQWSFSYDVLGRVATSDNQGTPVSPRVQFTYGYDANNNQTSRTDRIAGIQAGSIARTFDNRDRVASIQQNSGGAVNRRVDFEYDKSGLFKSLTRYRDAARQQQVAKTTYSYDAAARLQQIKHTAIDQVLATYDYSWDAADRITRIISPDGVANYSYDATDQLVGADHTAQPDENYTYDLNGNRTLAGYQSGSNNLLLSDGRYTYSYDDNGKRILRTEISTGERTEYSWDHRNRLTSVIVKNSSGVVRSEVRYTYDVFDRRIRKSIDGDGAGPGVATIKQYVHDGDHVAYEFDSAGNITHRYLHGPAIDMVLADETGSGAVHWMLTDHLGTVRDIIDSSGGIINHIQYDSFGRILTQSNAAWTPTFAYTGREWDPETGLFQYRARYYDSAVGRFVSEDPIRFASRQWSLIAYVGNNPVVLIDPYGLESGSEAMARSPGSVGRNYRDFAASARKETPEAAAFRQQSAQVMQTLGGIATITVGLAIVPASLGWGTIVAGAFIAKGIDDVQAGVRGRPTLVHEAVKHQTGSEDAAIAADIVTDVATVAVGGAKVPGKTPTPRATPKTPAATFKGGKVDSINGKPVAPKGPKPGQGDMKTTPTPKNPNQVKPCPTPENLIRGLKGERNRGPAIKYWLDGGEKQAFKDFDSLQPRNVKTIKTQYGEGRSGVLPDGRKVTVRPGSSGGPPTLEFPKKDGLVIKIRYRP